MALQIKGCNSGESVLSQPNSGMAQQQVKQNPIPSKKNSLILQEQHLGQDPVHHPAKKDVQQVVQNFLTYEGGVEFTGSRLCLSVLVTSTAIASTATTHARRTISLNSALGGSTGGFLQSAGHNFSRQMKILSEIFNPLVGQIPSKMRN